MIEKPVYAIVEANVGLIADAAVDCHAEYDFVLGQLRAMPGIFGFALKAVTVLFALLTGLTCCRDRASRQRLIARLNNTRWPVLRDLAAFYQSLTVLAHYQETGDV